MYTYSNGVKGKFIVVSKSVQERATYLNTLIFGIQLYFILYSSYEYIHERSTFNQLMWFYFVNMFIRYFLRFTESDKESLAHFE
jgi:hypothetical protein